jgi:hypothetical protein
MVANLAALAENVLEPIYTLLGPTSGIYAPQSSKGMWSINSGLRNGTNGSDHNKGRAFDMQYLPRRSFKEMWQLAVDLEKLLETNFTIDNFREDCKSIEVKPIVLDLEMKEGSIKDVMTSSKHFGDNRSAYEEANRITNELTSLGYKVVRKKIETVPWHPAAPTFNTGEPIPNGCYFESHIGVVISPEEKPYLEGLVEELNAGFFSPSRGFSRPSQIELGGTCKLSQNFFKKSKDGSKFVNMLTYRDSMTCKEDFERDVELIKFLLNEDKFGFEKVEVEYALYDTNVNHDSKWILGT